MPGATVDQKMEEEILDHVDPEITSQNDRVKVAAAAMQAVGGLEISPEEMKLVSLRTTYGSLTADPAPTGQPQIRFDHFTDPHFRIPVEWLGQEQYW